MFFIGPTLILNLINITCFLATIYNINKTRVPNDLSETIMADRSMAKIFAKIGGLMDVTWLFAFVPYMTGIDKLWFAFIISNGLQGIFIFFSSGITDIITQNICKNFKNTNAEIITEMGSVQITTLTN